MEGNFFKNKEILNGWNEIMFFENGSTEWDMRVLVSACMESHSGQKGIEFPKRYRVAKIVYRVALKQQNDTENRGKTSRVLHFQKYHIEMTQNDMSSQSRIYNKNNLSRISH